MKDPSEWDQGSLVGRVANNGRIGDGQKLGPTAAQYLVDDGGTVVAGDVHGVDGVLKGARSCAFVGLVLPGASPMGP